MTTPIAARALGFGPLRLIVFVCVCVRSMLCYELEEAQHTRVCLCMHGEMHLTTTVRARKGIDAKPTIGNCARQRFGINKQYIIYIYIVVEYGVMLRTRIINRPCSSAGK